MASNLLKMFRDLPRAANHGVPASPPGELRLQGERMDWPPLGEASRIGSTPATNVMAVVPPSCLPAVATIITASPLGSRVLRETRRCAAPWEAAVSGVGILR